MSEQSQEASDLIQQRQKKLRAIAELGFELYPRKTDVTHTLPQISSPNIRRARPRSWPPRKFPFASRAG